MIYQLTDRQTEMRVGPDKLDLFPLFTCSELSENRMSSAGCEV